MKSKTSLKYTSFDPPFKMGNHISGAGHGSPATGKVILLDGSIQEFNESITVAELMLEHPQQVVIELNESMVGQKREHPTALPADTKLDVNRFYAMVPLHRGKLAPLSHQEAHLILLRASVVLRSKTMASSSSKFLPLFARILPTGWSIEDSYPEIEVPKKGTLALMEERKMEEFHDDDDDDDGGVEGLELIERADLLKRKASAKGWKPSLDPIEEKKCETNEVPNWVSLAIKIGKRIEQKGLIWG